MDSHVEDQSSLFRSHLSTLASAQSLLNKRSSVGNARGSRKAWEVWGSLPALRNPDILISSEGAAPSKGPDKRAQFRGTPDEVGSLRREPPWAEESTAGPVDEIMLLYPSEVGGPIAQSRMDTLEQGTQTLGCGSHWSYSDFSSAQSDLASWASMHNLSLHLSQLLHSTSELLGSLSQPSVAEKEWNAKRDTPHEVPQTQMTDGSTQTTVDEGIQTDLASPPLHLQAPEADPQKVNVILEGLGSDLTSMCQGKGRVPRALQKRKAEETVWKTAGPLDLQGEDNLCRPQSAPVPSFHFNLQKGPFGQNLPSLSPQASPDALLPPSSQAEEPSCLAVGRPCLSAFPPQGPAPTLWSLLGSSGCRSRGPPAPCWWTGPPPRSSHLVPAPQGRGSPQVPCLFHLPQLFPLTAARNSCPAQAFPFLPPGLQWVIFLKPLMRQMALREQGLHVEKVEVP